MPEFVSSYSRILFSLLGPGMQELSKYTQQYSTANTKEPTSSHSPILSSQQIQEAYSHPSAVIQQAFRTTSIIQRALNAAKVQLETIAEQRSNIESSLIKLHQIENKDKQYDTNKLSI